MSKPRAKREKAIANKAVLLSQHLSGIEKSIAGWLIEHCNPKSGLCCPSLPRLAALAGCNERTVRRAVKKFAGGKQNEDGTFEFPVLIRYVSNGGPGGSSLYDIDFAEMKRFVKDEERRFASLRHWTSLWGVDPTDGGQLVETNANSDDGRWRQEDGSQSDTGHSCPEHRTKLSKSLDNNVHQNHLINHVKKPRGELANGKDTVQYQGSLSSKYLPVPLKPPSHCLVAERKANERITNDLKSRLPKHQFEEVLGSTDLETEQEAIDTEVNKPGTGAQLLIERHNKRRGS